MELAIINGTYRDTKGGGPQTTLPNGASPPSSASPLINHGNPAAIAAAVASRKWRNVVMQHRASVPECTHPHIV